MSPGIEIHHNRALVAEIDVHLRACNASFVPPLSERVDISTFAQKIAARAERFEAWANQRLAGLVAAYCNDPERSVAFLTNVSVIPSYQGQDIASSLLQACIGHVRRSGFERIELEVDLLNLAATRLYHKHGFTIGSANLHSQILQLAV